MTEKRFATNGYKIYDTFHDGVHWLVNEVEAEEIVAKMNNLDIKARERGKHLSKLQKENNQLKKENQYWLKTVSHFDNISHKDRDYVKRIYKENKKLKEKIAKFKEWEKYIRDVRREDLDRVFKMSVYEIAEAFGYYEERIKKLEKELKNE